MYRLIKHRRKSAKTNYKKRVASLKSGMRRVVVRKSNRAIFMQVIEYSKDGDKVLASASSRELDKMDWKPKCNMPTAYLTGLLLAKKVADKKTDYILDIGLYRPVKGSVVFAAAKGFKDGGANLHGNIEINESRLKGSHIADYASKAGDEYYKSRFSNYIKSGFNVKSINQIFEEVKKNLLK